MVAFGVGVTAATPSAKDAKRILQAVDVALYVAPSKVGPVAFTLYWIAPAATTQPLLEWWNLGADGAFKRDGQRITRTGADIPDAGGLIPEKGAGDIVEVQRLGTAKLRAVVKGRPHALFGPDRDQPIVLAERFLDALLPHWEFNDWYEFRSLGHLKPVAAWRDGQFAALIMPVRIAT